MESKKMKILAIDDDKDNLTSIKALIQEAFPEAITRTALNGKRGLELAAAEDPDVILLDVVMPDMDGFEVCRVLKADKNLRDIPVVFITAAKGNKEGRILALEVGAEAFLGKPIETSELTAQIRAMVKIKSANIEKRTEKEHLTILIDEQVRELQETQTATLNLLEDLKNKNEARKKSEAELRVSEERFRKVFEEGPLGMAMVDLIDGRILSVNRAYCDMLGYTEEELKRLTLVDVTHPDHHNEVVDSIQKIREEQITISQIEKRYLKKNGEVIWASRALTKITDAEGELSYCLAIVEDITKRKQAEEALKESEEKYRKLIETTSEGFWFLSPENKTIDVNQSLCDMTGYSRDEMIGKTPFDFVDDENLIIFKEQISKITSTLHRTYEILLRKKNGINFPTFFNATSLFDKKGKLVGSFAFIKDITERKRMESEKLELEDKFRESQKMESIGTLAGGIAHDFNNLLTVIQGHAQMAMMAMDENNPQYRDLTQIMNSSTRAASLTRQLLLFSRKQTVELKTLELNQTIQNLLKMLQRLIGENIIIETELATDLSNIEADEGNIEQVIMNLAVNARDAMPDGGKLTFLTENISIPDDEQSHVQDSQAGDFVRISVQDTGCGIPKEVLSKIFEPFFSTKEKGKGTGLGLSVVYGIVKSHNGWINAYSEPQQGTTFKIYLPASVSASTEESATQVESRESLHGNGEQILVIEDEQGILDFASSALRQFGYTIRVASNGHQALSVFEEAKGNFQLIISDVILPDINGFDLVSKLTKEYPDIPVIMCSGYTEERVKQSIIRDKGFRFLQKPYSINELLIAVKKTILKSGEN